VLVESDAGFVEKGLFEKNIWSTLGERSYVEVPSLEHTSVNAAKVR
jgi:hypothetical protein